MFNVIILLRKKAVLAAGVLLAAAAVILFSFSGRNVPIFSKSNGKIIVLDAGHGDPDGGAVGAAGTVESKVNLAVAKKLRSQLEKRGFTVIMTREDENGIYSDETASIREKKKDDMHNRLKIANESGADLFISIHMNLFQNSKYRGAEVLYSEKFENALLLAELIQAEFAAIDPENQTRTVKKADSGLYLMKNAEIPAVLAECGFLSNPEEEKLLNTKAYQERIAAAICDGIVEYYRSIEVRNKML